MPEITYILSDGTRRTVSASAGDSVMRAAVMNDVRGIDGECGGCLSCATCHVYVDAEWLAKLPACDPMEIELLSTVADERREGSRLGCQITLDATLDGLVVTMPGRQT
ncbi:2Fe-2S iron-sulfur cluster-binding protein [Variovorax sp. VNK109]|uniref:2Fe-2S iron-sulfur cluster-binding protein n=1 Tax=Variovorax sp. VNK109 TaxID=3400919 RepID=UPI003BFCE4BC